MRRISRRMLRDRVTVYPYVSDGTRGRNEGNPFVVRCRWREKDVVRDTDGRRRHTADAEIIMPLLRGDARTVQHATDVVVSPQTTANARVGQTRYPTVGGGWVFPFVTKRTERHLVEATVHDRKIRVEDRIVFRGENFEIVGFRTVDELLAGPSFYRVDVRKKR